MALGEGARIYAYIVPLKATMYHRQYTCERVYLLSEHRFTLIEWLAVHVCRQLYCAYVLYAYIHTRNASLSVRRNRFFYANA